MFNTKLMKIFYACLALGNLFIPMKRGSGGYTFSISNFNIIALVIMFYAMLIGLGYFKQNIPFLWVGVLRIVQGIYKFLIHPEAFNWYGYLALVLMDVFYIFFLMMDRRNYSYVEEDADEDEEDNEELMEGEQHEY